MGTKRFLMVSSSVVAMVSMAFGILGLAACLCCKDVDSKMTNKVSDVIFYLGIYHRETNGPLFLDRGVSRKHRSFGAKQVSLDSTV